MWSISLTINKIEPEFRQFLLRKNLWSFFFRFNRPGHVDVKFENTLKKNDITYYTFVLNSWTIFTWNNKYYLNASAYTNSVNIQYDVVVIDVDFLSDMY